MTKLTLAFGFVAIPLDFETGYFFRFSFVGSENSDPFHSGNSEPSGTSRKG